MRTQQERSSNMDRNVMAPRLISLGLAGTAAGVASLVMRTNGQQELFIPIILNSALAIAVLGVLSWREHLDKFNPMFWICVAMVVMYCLHPAMFIITGEINQYYHDSYDVRPGYALAIWLSSAAIASVSAGYFARALFQRERPAVLSLRTDVSADQLASDLRTCLIWARVFLVSSLLAFSLFAITTGQNPVSSFLGGARRGAQTDSTAYLYLAPQMLGPTTLIYLYISHRIGKPPRAALGLAALQVFIYVPTGQRLVLLITLVPAAVAWGVLRGVTVNVPRLLIIGFMCFVGITALRDLSSGVAAAGEAMAESATNPQKSAEKLLTGADTEMVDGLALEVQFVPAQLDHQPGHTLYSLLAAPIPSLIWPDKPQTADGILNGALLGVERNNASVAYGWIGELYFDSGLFGVSVGFAILGWFTHRLYSWYRNAPSEFNVLILACMGPLAVTLVRGSLALIVARALFVVGPLIWLSWRLGQSRDTDHAQMLPKAVMERR
jgi:hypothetical protein